MDPRRKVVTPFFFQLLRFLQEARALFQTQSLACSSPEKSPFATILFIPFSAEPKKLESDWAVVCSQIILRRCPVCERDSIVGHGRRRKHAHGQDHDWIPIRRGLCNLCGKTFTFLPQFSPPYGPYRRLARSQARRRYFLESRWGGGCSVMPHSFLAWGRCG
jgi:hypothetical protein